MIKKALIILFFIAFKQAIIESPLKSSYKGDIYYPTKPEHFHEKKEGHWTEIYFFFDSQCSLSTNKKEKLEKYFRKKRNIGKIPGFNLYYDED